MQDKLSQIWQFFTLIIEVGVLIKQSSTDFFSDYEGVDLF